MLKKYIILLLVSAPYPVFADELSELSIHEETASLATRGFERDLPRKYIERALAEFARRNGQIIVEIGSPRLPLPHPATQTECMLEYACLEGHSAIFWALTGKEVYSVDISPISIDVTREMCKDFPNVRVIQDDGINFLRNFNKPIDLLFLDAWDAESDQFAEKHLEAYLIAKKNLHQNSIILIDDTDLYNNNGKGRLVIPQAIRDGYRVIFNGRQTMLTKN